MGTRLSNNIAKRKYLDRNKLFLNFRSGDLVEINLSSEYSLTYSLTCKLRPIKKNNKGKFTYLDHSTFPIKEGFYKSFNNGQIGLFLGRYDGYAILLINEGLYACAVACIKKLEGNNG